MPIIKTYDVPKFDDYSYCSDEALQKTIDASRYQGYLLVQKEKQKK